MTGLLSLRGVTSGYGHLQVLHNIDLDIEKESVAALIGPNGHGKSTLLRTIAGLNRTWSGEMMFNGTPVPNSTADRAASGMVLVPQGDQLFMDMTVEENLMMGGFTQSDLTNLRSVLDEVYALFPKLADRRKQRANSLSGGERRMVGIGRGMMAEGDLMMIDEPSLGLAPLIIEQIYEALAGLATAARSILVVEENPSRVADIGSQFFLMDGGKIAWNGNAQELAASDDVVRTYLGG